MQDRSGLTIRRYIASMLNHLKSLQAARNEQFDSVSTEDTVPVSTDNGYHFVQARGGFRYLGSNALLAARPDFLSVPGASPASTATRLEFPPVASLAGIVDSQWHQVLVGRYVQVLHKMYPVIDANQPCLQQPPGPSSNLSTFESFLSKMVCSIACHCLPGNDNSLVLLSDALYAEALVSLESITTDQDVEALQAILLLALRSLFDAQKGNIGQQVTFAQRLLTELGSRDVEDARATLQRLQCAVYCIGSEAATVLDRPPAVIAPVSGTLVYTLMVLILKSRTTNLLSARLTRTCFCARCIQRNRGRRVKSPLMGSKSLYKPSSKRSSTRLAFSRRCAKACS